MAAGKVWLVGAGPGDIGLFTLKGAAVLQQADVVVYDSLVGEGVLAKIPEHARLINVGKRANHHTMVQEDINKVLLEEAARWCGKMQECAGKCNLRRVMTCPSTPRFPAALPLPP